MAFFRNAVNVISPVVGLSQKKNGLYNGKFSAHILPVSFHLNIVNISIVAKNQEKENKNPKGGQERPNFYN